MTSSLAARTAPPPALAIPAARTTLPTMPDVFVTPPDGADPFCAFSSARERRDVDSGLPSPSAPDFAALERALEFLERDAPTRHRRTAEVTALPIPYREEAPPVDDLQEEDVAPTPTPMPKTLRTRASLVFKKAFHGASQPLVISHDEGLAKCAVPPVSSPTTLEPASVAQPRQKTKARSFLPSLFFGDERKKGGSSFLRRAKKQRKDDDRRASTPAAAAPSQSLRRRPFSVLGLRRNPSASSKSPSPPASPRSSFSHTTPASPTTSTSTTVSTHTASTLTSDADLMTLPLASKTSKARIDSFHFDSAELFDPYTFSMR